LVALRLTKVAGLPRSYEGLPGATLGFVLSNALETEMYPSVNQAPCGLVVVCLGMLAL